MHRAVWERSKVNDPGDHEPVFVRAFAPQKVAFDGLVLFSAGLLIKICEKGEMCIQYHNTWDMGRTFLRKQKINLD
jgi:hypothetical protein